MSKKVLIIAYYWPPAGGPGVQRWLKFVKYLPQYNVEPIVFVPENANYPIKDMSLIDQVPEGVKVVKHSIKEPYKWAAMLSKKSSKTISSGVIKDESKQSVLEKLMLYVRGNYFIPDARKNWVKPSFSVICDILIKQSIQTVITTGPPHSLHLIGLKLKQEFGVKWIADFRDPWTTIGYHKALRLTKKSKEKHLFLEKKVLNTADQVIVTSHVTKTEFKQLTTKPIAVITNGFDDVLTAKNTPSLDVKFSMVHIGSLLSKRNPVVLWRVLSDLIKENKDFSKDFELKFIGLVSEAVLQNLNKYNLSNYIDNKGYVSHSECVEYQKKSQVLLLIEIDSNETRCIIPGKLFEYMAASRPILALGPKASDVEKLIKETCTGNYFYYDEYLVLKQHVLSLYQAFKNNTLSVTPIGVNKYHRRELTKTLSKLI